MADINVPTAVGPRGPVTGGCGDLGPSDGYAGPRTLVGALIGRLLGSCPAWEGAPPCPSPGGHRHWLDPQVPSEGLRTQ